jgi:uncharacterized protein
VRHDYDSVDYWEWCNREQFRLPFCEACNYFVHFPRSRCPRCWRSPLSWSPVDGNGYLYTYVRYQTGGFPLFGLVELIVQSELRIPAPIVDSGPGVPPIGQPMELRWIVIGEQKAPAFAPIGWT